MVYGKHPERATIVLSRLKVSRPAKVSRKKSASAALLERASTESGMPGTKGFAIKAK